MMLALQRQGCHNINLVSPSHVVAQIIRAVEIAARSGLRLPLVYNTGGYDSPEALALLDGIIDIYMPDMKYGDSSVARRYSRVRNYVESNRTAVREMHRQVGDLVLDGHGIAQRGLLVRHLVLPGNLAGTEQVLATSTTPATGPGRIRPWTGPCARGSTSQPWRWLQGTVCITWTGAGAAAEVAASSA
jgi:putative pyruvate formate lyase activating enzyme